MQRLVSRKDRYDIAFGCDTDHDRHGIVVRKGGLMPPNHYLTVMIDYLFNDRTRWRSTVAVGKTVVSSALIDRLAARLGRRLYEVPVGFKWFVDGLYEGNLGFAGEESAGSSFLRRNGKVWTTDKDGISAGLLAVEMTARRGVDPAEIYRRLTDELGTPYADRIDVAANAAQKACVGGLSREAFVAPTLAGETVESVEDHAPGNDAPIGGIKVVTADGWFAVRPSGTEDLMKLYGESFDSARHLQAILHDAQQLVEAALRNEA